MYRLRVSPVLTAVLLLFVASGRAIACTGTGPPVNHWPDILYRVAAGALALFGIALAMGVSLRSGKLPRKNDEAH